MSNISVPKGNGGVTASKYQRKGRMKLSMITSSVLAPASGAHYGIVCLGKNWAGRGSILTTLLLVASVASFSCFDSPQ